MSNSIAQVIPIQKTPRGVDFFDYLIPDNLQGVVKPGVVVEIPFRQGKTSGIVWRLVAQSKYENLKTILSIKSSLPSLRPEQIRLLEWFSAYYCYSMPSTLKLFLPPPLKQQTRVVKAENTKSCNDVMIKPVKEIISLVRKVFNAKNEKFLIVENDFAAHEQLLFAAITQGVQRHDQTLIILPHVEYIESLASRLPKELRDQVAVVNKRQLLSKVKYNKIWQEIRANDKRVIIGTRQAVFFSFKKLKTIIVAEADSADLVSWDQKPRFSALTVAKKLQEILGSTLVVASAAPRVIDFYDARAAGYQLLDLGEKKWTEHLTIVDLLDERRREFTYLSDKIITQITQVLENKGKALLIVNKLGFSSQIICRDCGFVPHCPKCARPFVVTNNQLRCANCGQTQNIPVACPNCSSLKWRPLGIGIEQIEQIIKAQFPQAKVSSSMATAADIYLSTVQLSDNNFLKNIDLLGIVYVDSSMYLPDYSINEELYEVLVNLIFRYMSLANGPQVIIQTALKDNPAIRHLGKSYLNFYREEIAARRRYSYPPFSKIIKLFFEHHDEGVALFEADNFYHEINLLCREHNIEITAPYSYYKKQVRGRFRVQILLKFKPNNQAVDKYILPRVPNHWTIDREPVNVL